MMRRGMEFRRFRVLVDAEGSGGGFPRTAARAEDGCISRGFAGGCRTYAAATEESALVKGLILMNATPFWAFVPSDRESLV